MAPYTARTGGIFGSGLYPNSRPQIDIGGGIDAVTRGATSLIQNAYQRRLADEQRQIQAEERARQHSREDVLDARSAEQFQMKKDEHAAQMAASGYTPEHQETTTAVEEGAVKSNGLFGAPGSVTAPKVTTKTNTVRGAYDYTKSTAYKIATETRTRKALNFSAAYKQVHPEATDDEAMQFGLEAADNPSLADNMLYPRPAATTVHQQNRDYDVKHPLPPRTSAGSASSSIGKALTTTNQRIDDNARDRAQSQTRIKSRFRRGLESAETAADSTDYRNMVTADDSIATEGTRLKGLRDNLSKRQLKDSGLSGDTAASTPPAKKPTITAAEAKALRDKGFTDQQISEKYTVTK